MAYPSIPYPELETIFLDVGNTLVSMDYAWIREELETRGVTVELETLRRAEAAARPVISRAIARRRSTEGRHTFSLYLKTILTKLTVPSSRISALSDELLPVFRGPGRERLWSCVLPGIPEALATLKSLGLRLVVVSNSDGTVERMLAAQGLRPYLDAVFDSHVVGFEKPDPRLFVHALEQTGARPETTLHIGDLYTADVEGGRAAGIHTALVDPYDDWADVECTRFPDLGAAARTIAAARK